VKVSLKLKDDKFLIEYGGKTVGFAVFDYRFFDNGWIELLEIEEEYRGKGIGVQAVNKLCEICKTKKIFTSTNESNAPMRKMLEKAGFEYMGKVEGLDDGDPELFFRRML